MPERGVFLYGSRPGDRRVRGSGRALGAVRRDRHGDYEALLSKILSDENRFLEQNKIILASDAGDVAAALKIANLVKSLHQRTRLPGTPAH